MKNCEIRHIRKAIVMAVASVIVVLCVPASVMANAPYEPNNDAKNAAGPLLNGEIYSAAIEGAYDGDLGSLDDEDWFFLYASGDTQVSLSIRNNARPKVCDPKYPQLIVGFDEDDYGETLTVRPGEQVQIDYKLSAGKHNLGVWGYQPVASYEIQVESDLSLSSVPVQPTSKCKKAKAKLKRVKKQYRAAKRKVRKANSRRAKRTARKKMASKRRAYQRARKSVKRTCEPQAKRISTKSVLSESESRDESL